MDTRGLITLAMDITAITAAIPLPVLSSAGLQARYSVPPPRGTATQAPAQPSAVRSARWPEQRSLTDTADGPPPEAPKQLFSH
jgi:hypothetical protein